MADSSPAKTLTAAQLHALYDILTHHETYAEIRAFTLPTTIDTYGPPFQTSIPAGSSSPVLQTLLAKFILTLPGLRDVPQEFWTVQVEDIIRRLGEAELSESYDKGVLGVRKTLATACAALIEYPARGVLDGVERVEGKGVKQTRREYDVKNAEDVLQAWQDGLQEAVYGDLVAEIFAKVAETDDLEQHPSMVRAMHEFILVNIASLMHFTLVLSPEGSTIIRLLETCHTLIPYMIIRQTLKIGNVASMLSAMMRVILAKVSLSSVTNWMGWSKNADEGMNLMQQIISQVLNWDKRDLKKRADKIESDKGGPPKEVLAELKNWITRSRQEHEECRRQSRESNMSMVAVILATSSLSTELSHDQHEKAAEYLRYHLSIRDRTEIVRVLCQSNPDQLTTATRDGVDAYTPMIRNVHQVADLSDSMWDTERFITDMLKISKPSGPKGQEKPATVDAFVDLLHRHQSSLHKFLHQVALKGKDVTNWWLDWCNRAVLQFRRDDNTTATPSDTTAVPPAGKVRTALNDIFAATPQADRTAIIAELATYTQYLSDLHTGSAARIAAVIKRDQSTPFGPGAYLARWQQLLDSTSITPATAKGPVRFGNSKSVLVESQKDGDSDAPTGVRVGEKMPESPKSEVVLRVYGEKFRGLIAAK